MGVGWVPAKPARKLRRGDVIVRPYGARWTVLGVERVRKSVHLRLRNDHGTLEFMAKRPGTLVGLGK
jgi:hypothetical protein